MIVETRDPNYATPNPAPNAPSVHVTVSALAASGGYVKGGPAARNRWGRCVDAHGRGGVREGPQGRDHPVTPAANIGRRASLTRTQHTT